MDDAPLPTALAPDAVFPNPVHNAVTLRYALPTTAAVRLAAGGTTATQRVTVVR